MKRLSRAALVALVALVAPVAPANRRLLGAYRPNTGFLAAINSIIGLRRFGLCPAPSVVRATIAEQVSSNRARMARL